jgi:hypothetical protein
MKFEVYTHLRINDDFSVIDFMSEGKKGYIPKRIVFSATEWEGVYNLAFGDINENGEIDDYCISDNGDRNKILATIADVVKAYTEKYPDRLIFFRGSTNERTRLYRMAVGLNLKELSRQFEIYAYVNEEIVPFEKNLEITAFLIKRKIV